MSKGKKICPKCSKECGAKMRICACGHEFYEKKSRKTKVVAQKVQEDSEQTLPTNN